MTQGSVDPARAARFEALVGRVLDPVLRYVRRRVDASVADDVVAETLTVLWRRLDDVPDGAELAWTYGVARRCLANSRRGAKRRLRLVERATAQAETDASTGAGAYPGLDTVIDETDPELARALARLGDDDREVLHLWAWEQLEPREIAAVLDITANAASIRLHRAKQRLRQALTPESVAPPLDTNGDEDREQPSERKETT